MLSDIISIETVVRIVVFLAYAPTCIVVYWKLIPRLSRLSMLLATLMLVAQVALILVFLAEQHTSRFERWFWHLSMERNGATALATAQLALVSVVALVTAWLARARSPWQRIYLAAVGLVFCFMTVDEYFELHESIHSWLFHVLMGGLIVVATVRMAARAPRQMRIWHACLLIGLALAAIGAIVLEQFRFRDVCANIGFWQNWCRTHDIEEALEFVGAWLALVAMLGHFSRLAPPARTYVATLLFFVPALLILALSPAGFVEYIEFRFLARPAAVQYESGLELQAFRAQRSEDYIALQIFASISRWENYSGAVYSLHLVDQESGESIAGTDQSARRRRQWRVRYIDDGVGERYWMYTQRLELAIPPQTPPNRALWIVLTVSRRDGEEHIRQKIVSSDLILLDEAQLVLEEMVLPAASTDAATDPLATFETGFTLDALDLPESARPGEILSIPFNWRAARDGAEDYVQFLHFIHDESGEHWGYDQQPLGARLPTRLWYSGLAAEEIWQVPLPADLAAGRYRLYTGLYRLSDLERLPASNAAGMLYPDARIPLGFITIE